MWVQISLQSLKLQISCFWQGVPWHHTTIACGSTLKRVHDMIVTYNQLHRTNKYSQHSSVNLLVWQNGWVFVYELSGCGFESHCSQLNLRCHACFMLKVPRNSGNYAVWIHSETRTWYDKNIQLWIHIDKINKMVKKT